MNWHPGKGSPLDAAAAHRLAGPRAGTWTDPDGFFQCSPRGTDPSVHSQVPRGGAKTPRSASRERAATALGWDGRVSHRTLPPGASFPPGREKGWRQSCRILGSINARRCGLTLMCSQPSHRFVPQPWPMMLPSLRKMCRAGMDIDLQNSRHASPCLWLGTGGKHRPQSHTESTLPKVTVTDGDSEVRSHPAHLSGQDRPVPGKPCPA